MLFVHKMTYLACADICQPVLVGLDTFARHSPTIFPVSIHLPDIPQPFPRTRYIRSHLTFAIFEKNVTRLDTFARVICHFGKFGASGHCLTSLQSYTLNTLNHGQKIEFHNIETGPIESIFFTRSKYSILWPTVGQRNKSFGFAHLTR
jgi:hypothetical protein